MADEPLVLRMTWRDGLFAHWRVPVDALRRHVPDPLTIDTFDGSAWIGLLPFRVEGFRPHGVPQFAGLTFPEVNVRTYVRYDGYPGTYFLDIAVGSRLVAALASALTPLPYRHDGLGMETDTAGGVTVTRRVGGETPLSRLASFRPAGEAVRPTEGTLAHWLSARHRVFEAVDDRVYSGRLRHRPWALQPAQATVDVAAALGHLGIDPDGEPVTHYSARQPMIASPVLPVETTPDGTGAERDRRRPVADSPP